MGHYAKAIVALLVPFAAALLEGAGVEIDTPVLDEMVLAVVTAILVYAVPNRAKRGSPPFRG